MRDGERHLAKSTVRATRATATKGVKRLTAARCCFFGGKNFYSIITRIHAWSNNVQYPYKLQLQTYAQRNHLSLPSYSVTSMGPQHDCHFVACVTVGEQDFRSSAASKTVKEAENAAARAALSVLSPDGFEEIIKW
ncbi:hypothetical protein QQ045_008857 [Rhodiola kirilowii]